MVCVECSDGDMAAGTRHWKAMGVLFVKRWMFKQCKQVSLPDHGEGLL